MYLKFTISGMIGNLSKKVEFLVSVPTLVVCTIAGVE